MEPRKPLLIRYLFAQTGKQSPRVSFVGTAKGDLERFLLGFYSTFANAGCVPTHLPFFDRTPDLREHVMGQDIVFVGGGNVKSMMAVWRDWGFVEVLKEAYDEGIVLAGISAGAICWFEQAVVDSYASGLRLIPALGFLSGSCCPHYDGEAQRRPSYSAFVASGEAGPGIAIDDAAAAHFVNGKLHRCVTSISGSGVYSVSAVSGRSEETPLATDVLS